MVEGNVRGKHLGGMFTLFIQLSSFEYCINICFLLLIAKLFYFSGGFRISGGRGVNCVLQCLTAGNPGTTLVLVVAIVILSSKSQFLSIFVKK